MRIWLLALAIFGGSLLVIRPWGNYPLNDDWQYARASRLFAETGKIKIDTPIAVTLEGGYSNDLPELIDAFVTGWQR